MERRKITGNKKIYLDYAATTPVDPVVLKAMLPYFSEEYGNPSSVHSFGQRALAAVDTAREEIAAFLGCEASEVVFTGSATEANNLAMQGVIRYFNSNLKSQNKSQISNLKSQISKPHLKSQNLHIITSSIEHDSVLETCHALEREGVEITYLPVSKEGFVRPEDVKNALKENTVLVSIMYANNEIGTIQPIAEIGKLLKSGILNLKSKIYFHTDAVQAVNYLDCNVDKLGVDLLTMSGHKIYGPKGVGVLYVRKGTPIEPLIYGGGQERGMRAGTENVAAIAGMGRALSQISNLKSQISNLNFQNRISKIKTLRDKLIDGVLKIIPDAKLNGSHENRLPNNVNFCFPGVDAEGLIVALDQEGIAVSSGSACSARAIKPSHVLLALGLSEKDARSSIRITLGKYTTEQEIEYFLKILPGVVKRIKMLS